jgi:hypothetical protein
MTPDERLIGGYMPLPARGYSASVARRTRRSALRAMYSPSGTSGNFRHELRAFRSAARIFPSAALDVLVCEREGALR